jgi:hypothetical protein
MAPQSKKDEFRQTFAHAMLEWKRVEGYLYEIFKRLIRREQNRNALTANYKSLKSFRGRLDMVNKSATKALAGMPLSDDWKRLYEKKVPEENEKRNKLAHFELTLDLGAGERLRRSVHENGIAENLDAKDLEGFRQSFSRTYLKIA